MKATCLGGSVIAMMWPLQASPLETSLNMKSVEQKSSFPIKLLSA